MTPPYSTTLHRFYRKAIRHGLRRGSTLRAADGLPLDVRIEDLSVKGCRLAGVHDLALHDAVLVGLAGVGARRARVAWVRDGEAGCQFDVPLLPEELDQTRQANTVVAATFGGRAPAIVDEAAGGTTRPWTSERAARDDAGDSANGTPMRPDRAKHLGLAIAALITVGLWVLIWAIVAGR